jgi:hypothetical protein
MKPQLRQAGATRGGKLGKFGGSIQEYAMGPLRSLVIAAATPLVVLLPIQPSAHAQSAPLSLTPPSLQAKRPPVAGEKRARKPIHVTRRHAAPAAVATAPALPTGAVASDGAVPLQDAAGVALIAQLPWWRTDEWDAARKEDPLGSNQVLAVARAWMGPGAVSVAAEPSERAPATVAQAPSRSVDGGTDDSLAASALADASELSTAGLGAGDPGPQHSWLIGLMVTLAGALAAVATACFLFGYRRRGIVLTD